MCKSMHATVMDQGTMPEAASVREAIEKLQELIDFLDGKKKILNRPERSNLLTLLS